MALDVVEDPHTQLPSAYLLSAPAALDGQLIPHISQDQCLCYVEQMEADWDPNDLALLYTEINRQISHTLRNSVAAAERGDPGNPEIEGEFGSYWCAGDTLYLLEEPNSQQILETWPVERKQPNKPIYREYVTTPPTSSSRKQLANWMLQRNLTADDVQKPLTTHYVKVKPSRLAGVMWPPSSLRDCVKWLEEVDVNARNQLAGHLYATNIKRHVVILDVQHQDMLAFYVELHLKASGAKRSKKPHQQKKSSRLKAVVVSAKHASSNFQRLNVIKADRNTLLSRNSRRSESACLSDKRIALVGCGTVGGYLAPLLLRAGAGCDALFHIYDPDVLLPHNFSRHPLSASNFIRYKATELANQLLGSVHIATNIKGIPSRFQVTTSTLSQYDIVIDATGRPPLSKRLAHVIRSMEDKRPTLIHAFNEGNGRASKVFIDDGTACYGCLLSEPSMYRKGIDLRFEHIDQASEKHISCGSIYTPYDAAVSHITAGLAQQAVLTTLESPLEWNYSEHLLDGQRSKKPRLIQSHQRCPICNAQ